MSHCSGILRPLDAQPLRSRDLGHSLDIRSILGQAVYALQNGDFKHATALANQVLSQYPNEPNSLQILGNVCAQQALN